jgi:hypothetical protein
MPFPPSEGEGVGVAVVVVAPAGTAVQVDALQIMPDGHMFPHMPQFAASDVSS